MGSRCASQDTCFRGSFCVSADFPGSSAKGPSKSPGSKWATHRAYWAYWAYWAQGDQSHSFTTWHVRKVQSFFILPLKHIKTKHTANSKQFKTHARFAESIDSLDIFHGASMYLSSKCGSFTDDEKRRHRRKHEKKEKQR